MLVEFIQHLVLVFYPKQFCHTSQGLHGVVNSLHQTIIVMMALDLHIAIFHSRVRLQDLIEYLFQFHVQKRRNNLIRKMRFPTKTTSIQKEHDVILA